MSATPVQRNFRAGIRQATPFLLVIVPFGVLFGVVATEAGLGVAEVMGFSLLVIAGAAQFTAVQLMSEHAPAVIVVATALAVNLRMAMYSAALTPHLGQVSVFRRVMIAYALTDQTYAAAGTRFEAEPDLPLAQKLAFYAGAAIPIAPFWYASTLAGALLGSAIPEGYGLDLALPVTFLAMIGPMLRTFAHVAAALTSVLVALVFAFLPSGLGLLVAAAAAMVVGAEVERRSAAP